jgi:hypothetical protein
MDLKDIKKVNLEHNMYILRCYGLNGQTLVKVGYSSKIRNRLCTYNRANPLIEFVTSFYANLGQKFELILHSSFPGYKTNKEWYEEKYLDLILNFIDKHNNTTDIKKLLKEAGKIKIIKESPKQYAMYVKEIRNCNDLKEKLEVLETIDTQTWKKYLQYGIETNNLQLNITAAKKHYETKFSYNILKEVIYDNFKLNTFYVATEIKEILNKIYKNMKLNKSPKSTDLYEFFEMKVTQKMKEGKNLKGFTLTLKK